MCLLLMFHTIEVLHIAQHYGMGKHAVVLLPQRPLIEVIGQREAQCARTQLHVAAELGTQ